MANLREAEFDTPEFVPWLALVLVSIILIGEFLSLGELIESSTTLLTTSISCLELDTLDLYISIANYSIISLTYFHISAYIFISIY